MKFTRSAASGRAATASLLLLFLPAVLIRFIQPLQFPMLNWDEGLWNASPKHTLLLGTPIAYNLGHIFLSPLHYATTLLLYWLFSPSLVLSRWLSAAFGMGVVFFTYKLGRRFADRRVALIAALFCAYNSLTILTSRRAMLEQEVTFYLVAAAYFWFHSRPGRVWLSGLFIAAALMVKANALAILPALVIGSLFFYYESSARLRWMRRTTKSQWLSLAAGITLTFLVYFGISRINPSLFDRTWSTHSVDRMVNVAATVHVSPRFLLSDLFEFLISFLRHFPDLIILAGVGFVVAWVRKWRPAVFLTVWFLSTFLLISAQNNRIAPYYYPLIPGLALLAAFALNDLLSPRRANRLKTIVLVAVVAAMCAGQIARFYPYYREGLRENPTFFEAAAQIEKLTDPREPIICTGFDMLLVPNPTIPLSQLVMDRWEVSRHQRSAVSIPWPRYAIMRNFDPDSGNDLGRFRDQFLSANFIRILDCKNDPRGRYGYIAQAKPEEVNVSP